MRISFLSTLSTLFVSFSLLSTIAANEEGIPAKRRHHAQIARELSHATEEHTLVKRAFSGQATFYGINPGDLGACGQPLSANDHIVALNSGQYGDLGAVSSFCFKEIVISDGKKQTTAKIMDACPEGGGNCHYGALDMSESLFKFFNDPGVGVFPITWHLADDNSSGGGSGRTGKDNPPANKPKDNNDWKAKQAADQKKQQDDAAAKKKAQDDARASQKAKDDAAKEQAADAKAAQDKKEADAKKAADSKKASDAKKAADDQRATDAWNAEQQRKKQEANDKKKNAEYTKQADSKAAQEQSKSQNQDQDQQEGQTQSNAKNIVSFGEIMLGLDHMVQDASSGQ